VESKPNHAKRPGNLFFPSNPACPARLCIYFLVLYSGIFYSQPCFFIISTQMPAAIILLQKLSEYRIACVASSTSSSSFIFVLGPALVAMSQRPGRSCRVRPCRRQSSARETQMKFFVLYSFSYKRIPTTADVSSSYAST